MGSKSDTDEITINAVVSQVRTMADGGVRVTLDLPEGYVYEAAWLMQVKQDEGIVRVYISTIDHEQPNITNE